jgi:UDP-N-acetylglucosamine--N-acetylmuramyl-(pentapeptide) pyrophosphoryl-undecaprenol N-acetylglucosamine transferase
LTTLLVAATGGHLSQLHHLHERLVGVDPDFVWVTFDTPQSRSLLAGERVVLANYTATRDYRHVIINTRVAARLLRHRELTAVVSTGAGVALSFLPLARARGLACHYIESATRHDGPSTTGRILARIPGIRLYAQHPSWARPPWRYRGSVFDGFEVEPLDGAAPSIRRAVVTLGAHPLYGFRRLLERLVQIMPPGADVVWQTGSTDVSGLPIEARPAMARHELADAMRQADLVIAHAGVGAALEALSAGRCPIVVPRDPALGEHVDNHQTQFAGDLQQRGVAIVRSVEELQPDDLAAAAARSVVRADAPPPFRLDS